MGGIKENNGNFRCIRENKWAKNQPGKKTHYDSRVGLGRGGAHRRDSGGKGM
jgi:hypothetical protein